MPARHTILVVEPADGLLQPLQLPLFWYCVRVQQPFVRSPQSLFYRDRRRPPQLAAYLFYVYNTPPDVVDVPPVHPDHVEVGASNFDDQAGELVDRRFPARADVINLALGLW